MKRILSLVLVGALTACSAGTRQTLPSVESAEVQQTAESAEVQQTAAHTEAQQSYDSSVYTTFLQNNPSCRYAAFLDMNGDGNPELLVYDGKSCGLDLNASESHTNAPWATVYSYDNGTVKQVMQENSSNYEFSLGTSMNVLSYNADMAAVTSTWGGCGCNQYISYTIEPNGLGRTTYLTYNNDDKKYYYEIYDSSQLSAVDTTEISKQEFDEYYDEWKQSQLIDFIEVNPPQSESEPEQEQESEPKSTLTFDEKIQEIRDIYYTIQDEVDDYTTNDCGSGVTQYYQGEAIRKIVALPGAYSSNSVGNSLDNYTAEYYYQDNHPVFVFVYTKDSQQEYRFYIDWHNSYNQCIRYIDDDGNIYDDSDGFSPTDKSDVGQFVSFAVLELEWSGILF